VKVDEQLTLLIGNQVQLQPAPFIFVTDLGYICYNLAHSKEKNALRYCLPPLKGRLAAEDVPELFIIIRKQQ
jgi:hypothetical protein